MSGRSEDDARKADSLRFAVCERLSRAWVEQVASSLGIPEKFVWAEIVYVSTQRARESRGE